MTPQADIERVIEAAPSVHGAGPLAGRAPKAIVRHCRKMELRHTAETGCGASTLLFSQLSEDHTVFAAAEDNDSLANVKGSSLLRPGVVTFIEGPTQATLPRHSFKHPLDCVLLDGPHGYPFPDLEYYFFYPHLSAGALLIVDDIHIPTVHNLFRFLTADAMFDLEDTAGSTAIFRRTDSPLFDPYGDGWWLQRFNRRVLLRYAWRQRLKQLLPREVESGLRRVRRRFRNGRRAKVSIGSPPRGQRVGPSGAVSVVAKLPEGGQVWVFVRRKDMPGWWPQGGGPLAIENGGGVVNVRYGEDCDAGFPFEICVLAVRDEIGKTWLQQTKRSAATGEFLASVSLPPAEFVLAESYRTVYRRLSGLPPP